MNFSNIVQSLFACEKLLSYIKIFKHLFENIRKNLKKKYIFFYYYFVCLKFEQSVFVIVSQ